VISHPNTEQDARDLLADIGLADLDDRAGSGDQARHDHEQWPDD
jgi:hypothetical protein